MLFRFQRQIEKLLQELGLGPGFNSISPLSCSKHLQYQVFDMNKDKYISMLMVRTWFTMATSKVKK